jgi:putative integral membrane protein (TIGR02587 family)
VTVSDTRPGGAPRRSESSLDYARGLARAFAGAVIFALPLLMTMEMWWFGFAMERLRLAAFMLAVVAVVLGLSFFVGFRNTANWSDDMLDGLAAVAVGFVAAFLILVLFGLITPETPLREVLGKTAVQAAPASIGAVVANKQLAAGDTQAREEREALRRTGYYGELFLMAAGALFVAFNVAPTEEMILIGYKMTPWHALALVAASLLLLHALVYTVGFGGQHEHQGHAAAFLHFTVAGYGLALLVSLFILWVFGRTDAGGVEDTLRAVVVLGFPASLGAAAARLLV